MKAPGFGALLSLVVVSWLAFAAGCGSQPSTSGDSKIAGKQKELATLDSKRQARLQELKAMSVPRLAQELATDSKKGVEPFNSMAYREIISRSESVAAELKGTLSAADASSLLSLLALRQISLAQYKSVEPGFRTKVLADALKSARFFNTWGLPHVFWEDAAKALIEEGKAMERLLIALLNDKREARVWGSEGAVEQQRYKYRVCDYAWALLNEIRGQPVAIPHDPAERDKLIGKTQK